MAQNKITLDGILTHTDLVEIARRWLTKQCAVVITEMANMSGETPDAIGWRSGHSIAIECKVSIQDFRANKKKGYRYRNGMGQQLYFLTPKGLIAYHEIHSGIGLLEWDGKKVYQSIKSEPRIEYDTTSEMLLLCSALRRIGQSCPKGMSVHHYTIETNNRATLGTRNLR